VGPRWGCLSVDPVTHFVVAWFSGRSEEAAPKVVRLTRQRTQGRVGLIWVSDGRAVYRREVRRTYRDSQRTGRRGRPPLGPTPGVGLTQTVKRRRRGRVVGVEVRVVWREPAKVPYPVHEERLNGVLRDRLNALTRKTHAFAKDPRT
jgi:IS1 family transposase